MICILILYLNISKNLGFLHNQFKLIALNIK
jgi:hypothetical protein